MNKTNISLIIFVILLSYLAASVVAKMIPADEFHKNTEKILEKHFSDIQNSVLTLEEGKDLYYFNKATKDFNVIDLSVKGTYSQKTIQEIYEKGLKWNEKEQLSRPKKSFKDNFLVPLLIIALCGAIIGMVILYMKKEHIDEREIGIDESSPQINQIEKEEVKPQYNEQLVSYIKKQIEKGFSEKQIAQVLENAGWKEQDIENAFYYIR